MITFIFGKVGEVTLLQKESQVPLASAMGLCRQQPGKPAQTFVTLVSLDQSNSVKGKDGNVFPTSVCLELNYLTAYLDHPVVVIFFFFN